MNLGGSTIIELSGFNPNDGYELIIPDICTYFVVRYPNQKGERVKHNILIGLEYYKKERTLIFTSYQKSKLQCQIDFKIEPYGVCGINFELKSSAKKAFFLFINIIFLYLFDVLKIAEIHLPILLKEYNLLKNSFFEKRKDQSYYCSREAFKQWLIPHKENIPILPIIFDKLSSSQESTHQLYKHFLSLKESIGICTRLRKIQLKQQW